MSPRHALHPVAPGDPLLQLDRVEVTYANGTRALQPSTFDIAAGSCVVLLGASGAGKSTLLRCLNGLVTPTGGAVTVADIGAPLHARGALRQHRRFTGMVFQHHHLIGRQSVLANVLMGRLSQQSAWASLWPAARAHKMAALAAIERVGLLDKALERADALSGGQQQRVGIARALLQQPRLMLADEPVASLDPATAQRVLALLHRICKADGLTAVLSLHQVSLALAFADRIVGLREGAVVFDGPPAAWSDGCEQLIYGTAPESPPRESIGNTSPPDRFTVPHQPLEASPS